MDSSIVRTCHKCGSVIKIFIDDRTDMTCQHCGSTEGIISGQGYKKFECLLCGLPFALETGTKQNLFHDFPHCKSKLVHYLGDADANDIEIISSDSPLKNIILFIRNRGLGDVLMTTAVLPYLKEKHGKDNLIWYACDEDIAPVLYNNPHIDRIIKSGQEKKFGGVGAVYNLLEKLEDYKVSNGANQKNRVKRIFELCDIDTTGKDLRPKYYITKEEEAWGKEILLGDKKVVAIGLESFAPFRSWPANKYIELGRRLAASGYTVLLLGTIGRPEIFGKNIINATGRLTIREVASLLKKSSLLICGDTGLYHFAEALHVKSIVMFGSIPDKARVSTYKYAYPIYKDDIPCVPCWDKQLGLGADNPICRIEEPACLKAITIEEVFNKTMELLK